MEEIIYKFIFPGFGDGYIFNENKWKGYKNDFMNFLLSLPKEHQLIGFFYPLSKKWENSLYPLDNFLQLRENKEALKLIYKMFSSLNAQNEEIDFDEILKMNPDSEIQSIIFLLLIAKCKIQNKKDFINQVKNIIINNFSKLDKMAQMIITFQINTFGIIFEGKKNEKNEILDFIFEKNYIIHKYFNKSIYEEISNEDIEKALNTYKDPETQIILFFFFSLKMKNGNIFYKMDKQSQIFFFKEFTRICFIGPGWLPFFLKLEKDVLVSVFDYLTSDAPDNKIYDVFKKLFEGIEEKSFILLSLQSQIKILQYAPKDEKVRYFSLLPDKYRTRKTLESIKDMDYNSVKQYIFNEKVQTKMENKEIKENNAVNSGLSKEDFKERLKFFNSSK